jgi:serine/threonine protein kinase
MKKSEYVVKYVDHWYDDNHEYCYVVTEYCAGGNLAQQIQKKIEENGKFVEVVCGYYLKL